MAKVLQIRRGTTAKNDAFTGAEGELTVDTEKHTLRVHDGSTVGGTELLPTTGGTMTGEIFKGGFALSNSANNSTGAIVISGDSDHSGAKVTLLGGSHASQAGYFVIAAKKGTDSSSLIGTPNQSLTWNSKNVETVDSSGTGWIRYTNGLQICWRDGFTSNNGAYENHITFQKSFSSAPALIVMPKQIGDGGVYKFSIYRLNTTSATIIVQDPNNSSTLTQNHPGCTNIAIGYWK